MFGKKILVLIPHPDDEVVGCFKAIRWAQSLGGKAFGFYLTTGIPSRDRLWPWQRKAYGRRLTRRHNEAQIAAKILGIEPFRFNDIPSRMLKNFLHPVRETLTRTIRDLEIDTVWTPTYEGGHEDHDASSFLASTLTGQAKVWEFSEYHFYGGKVKSQEFFSRNGTEQTFSLDRSEQDQKKEALSLYPSERGNLRHIDVLQEMFRPLPSYDYSRPPHSGKLFYQRFQWVPWHPRIDYCRPREVCLAFKDFLETVQY